MVLSRFYYVNQKRSRSVNSLRWLRGPNSDVGYEYGEMSNTISMLARKPGQPIREILTAR